MQIEMPLGGYVSIHITQKWDLNSHIGQERPERHSTAVSAIS
jgi:hypothetical protein